MPAQDGVGPHQQPQVLVSHYGLLMRRWENLFGLIATTAGEVVKIVKEGVDDPDKIVRIGFMVTLVTICAALIILVSR